ncbi:MAG: hypothetical protein ACTSW1_07320 [Candidatus Hodarchaeales archaeon]
MESKKEKQKETKPNIMEKNIKIKITSEGDRLSETELKALQKELSRGGKRGQKIKNSGGRIGQFYSSMLLRIPIISSLYLKRKIQSGSLCADIITKNMHSQRFVVDSGTPVLEIEMNNAVRFFNLQPIVKNPERYLKLEGVAPVATFYWDYPNPIPIRPTDIDIIDLELFGREVLRQRSKAAAQPIRDFLTTAVKKIDQTFIFSIIAAGASVLSFLYLSGYLGG